MARLTVKSNNTAGDIEMMTFTTCSLLTLHLNHYIHYILELGLVFSRSETFVFIVGVGMDVFTNNQLSVHHGGREGGEIWDQV